jgi:hypothetical protein
MPPKKQDYKIKPVELDNKEFNIVEKDLFIFPSLSCMVGHVASGKSTMLYNLITNIWDDVFEDRIILFSSSAGNDPLIKKLIKEQKILLYFTDYTNETLQEVLKLINEKFAEDKKPFLICFDDMLNLLPKHNTRQGKFWGSFISTYRHGGIPSGQEGSISLLIFTQYYKDLSPVIRSNLTYIGFLGAHSEKSKKVYSEELNAVCGGDEERFLEIYHEAKKDKYSFLFLDLRRLKAYKNFEECIYDSDNTERNQMKKAIEKPKTAKDIVEDLDELSEGDD